MFAIKGAVNEYGKTVYNVENLQNHIQICSPKSVCFIAYDEVNVHCSPAKCVFFPL